jgi:DNA-directed RNA polymerase specialized sigma24 family protein
MTDTNQLLREYVETGSEPAFREIVSRYVDLVYSVALRKLGGHEHLACDVVQTVFTDLARKAWRLRAESCLGG